jgi:exopolysaccharide biosynthesis polyprenyl glycosylphosphotransferase
MWVKNHVLDIAADIIAVLLAYVTCYGVARGALPVGTQWYGLFVALGIYFLSSLFPAGKSQKKSTLANVCLGAFRQTACMAALLGIFLFLFRENSNEVRSYYVIQILMLFLWLSLGRVLCRAFIYYYFRQEKNRTRLLVFANEENSLQAMHRLAISDLYQYELIALAMVDGASGDVRINRIGHGENGTYMVTEEKSLEEYLKRQAIDEVLLSLPYSRKEYISQLLKTLQSMGIVVHVSANSLGLSEEAKQVGELGEYRVLTYGTRIFTPAELFIKRGMDIIGALVGIVLTGIISVFTVPAICLESPGGVIFSQTRVGKNGRKFSIYKFRSMYSDAEARKKELMEKNEMKGLMFKIKDDPRVTRVGKFIRKTSIDELPQFFNVLMGDMSLVGTRPPTVDEFDQYEEHHKRRLSLKPGITGMWQVSGRSDIQDFEDVVRMDLEYIDNWSVWLDVKILFQTVWVVLFRKGAS